MRYSREYENLCARLVAMRKKARLTQRQLAKRLKVHHSIVGKMEVSGGRKVTVLEFIQWCRACKQDPAKVIRDLE
jgi:hypothetical protein